jgi:hypothetical protein
MPAPRPRVLLSRAIRGLSWKSRAVERERERERDREDEYERRRCRCEREREGERSWGREYLAISFWGTPRVDDAGV